MRLGFINRGDVNPGTLVELISSQSEGVGTPRSVCRLVCRCQTGNTPVTAVIVSNSPAIIRGVLFLALQGCAVLLWTLFTSPLLLTSWT